MDRSSAVWITGAVADGACGRGVEALWQRCRRGIRPAAEDATKEPMRFNAGSKPLSSRAHRLSQRLLAAVDKDLGQFFGSLSDEERQRVGVALGSAYGHLGSYFEYFQTGTERGYQLVNPRHFPRTLPNFCAIEVNNAYSLWGSSTAVGIGWSGGLEAIGYGVRAIQRGQEDTVLAGGLEELNDYNQHVLRSGGRCSPTGVIRSFSQARGGTLPAEGLALLLLQSPQAAERSGRKPMAVVRGVATARGIRGDKLGTCAKAAAAVRQLLDRIDLPLAKVDAVFPSASGSVAGDALEERYLNELFGSRLGGVPVYPIKTFTGECFGASGPLQCVAALYALSAAPQQTSERDAPKLGGGVRVEEVIDRQANALIYSIGYDGTFAALVLEGSAT